VENEKQDPFLKRLIRHIVTAIATCLAILGLMSKVMLFMKGGAWFQTGGAIVLYLLMIFLFIFRNATQEASVKPSHWVFAISGTLLPVILSITKGTPAFLTGISIPIEGLGLTFSVIALYTLGRSFGIVAAKREIKTQGVYKIIRHPLYAGETLWFLALVLQNISLFNIMLYLVQSACQVKRILEEEALLQKDDVYAQYMKEVPWWILPGVF
jgi:protein-S-isoprenylcysteine O-methyltransferase Ste14